MVTLLVCIALLILDTVCLGGLIATAVVMTRGHLTLARKDRAEILATKRTATDPTAWYWRGCECLICRIFDKIQMEKR